MNRFINPDDMKIGYGVLVHSTGVISRLIRCFTKSHWNHVAVSLGGYDIVEACALGVKLHNLKCSYNKPGVELKIINVKNTSREKQIKAALFAATKCNLGYDYIQFVLIGLILKLNKPNLVKRVNRFLYKITNSYICSEVYYDAWLMVGEELCPGKDISEITPADLDPTVNKNLVEILSWPLKS
jgi:uncharacterized protein YycO